MCVHALLYMVKKHEKKNLKHREKRIFAPLEPLLVLPTYENRNYKSVQSYKQFYMKY